jgi:hypothetical protein
MPFAVWIWKPSRPSRRSCRMSGPITIGLLKSYVRESSGRDLAELLSRAIRG